ncbi:MAG: hypothetical protein JNJ98_11165 [Gemmatimonadetes bacterium]|nr:hypothetical protein [Gemmatimonadota bacterium]
MPLTPEQRDLLARFPAALVALVEAELGAGNSMLGVRSGHPATPVGACITLTRKVSTRPRASGDGLRFRERSGSSHAGEFTDADAHFYVLEPPDPPPPERSMDEIRAELAERERRSDEERFRELFW